MAGSYPDIPAPRIATDLNGSVLIVTNGANGLPSGPPNSIWATATAAEMAIAADDAVLQAIWNSGNDDDWFGYVFPEAFDIYGFMMQTSGNSMAYYRYSPDTTNGLDGTWTYGTTGYNLPGSNLPRNEQYRNDIYTTDGPWTNCKSFQVWQGNRQMRRYDVFGYPTAGTLPHELVLWDVDAVNQLAPAALDFGDVPRGGVYTKTFKVKNVSATKRANQITLSIEDSLKGQYSPSAASRIMFSTTVSPSYTPTKALGDLLPGSVSYTITMRYSPDVTDGVGLRWARVVATPSSWA